MSLAGVVNNVKYHVSHMLQERGREGGGELIITHWGGGCITQTRVLINQVLQL